MAYRHNAKQRDERLEIPGEVWAPRPSRVSIPVVGVSTYAISETQIHYHSQSATVALAFLPTVVSVQAEAGSSGVTRVIYVSLRFCFGTREQEMGSQKIVWLQDLQNEQ